MRMGALQEPELAEYQDGAKARMRCAIACGARPAPASNDSQSPAVEILPLGSGHAQTQHRGSRGTTRQCRNDGRVQSSAQDMFLNCHHQPVAACKAPDEVGVERLQAGNADDAGVQAFLGESVRGSQTIRGNGAAGEQYDFVAFPEEVWPSRDRTVRPLQARARPHG